MNDAQRVELVNAAAQPWHGRAGAGEARPGMARQHRQGGARQVAVWQGRAGKDGAMSTDGYEDSYRIRQSSSFL
jgi:hypothetical protein